MAFVKFTESGRSFKPRVSIRQNGTMGLNYAALNRWKIGTFEWVLLFYDRDSKRIGLKPVRTEEEGAHKLNLGRNKKSAWISCRKFLDFFEIAPKATERYNATWDEREEMVVLQLP